MLKNKGTWNLLVSRTKSIVGFIISVLIVVLFRGSPKRSVLVRFESL